MVLSISLSPLSADARYKSITEMVWEDIPGFAVLTGRNGAGKTQLLEAIAYAMSGALPQGMQWGQQFPLRLTITGESYQPFEVSYVPGAGRFSGGAPASIANMPLLRQQALIDVQQRYSQINSIEATVRVRRIESLLRGKKAHQVQPDELRELLGDDYEFLLDDADVTTGLTHVFVAHRVKVLEAIERNTPGLDRDGSTLGPAPWDVVNEALAAAGYAYRVVSPLEASMFDAYNLVLEDASSGSRIPARDLSSGEQVLLQLVLWIFSSNKKGSFPKLLLLDEPDAHLHPAMTNQFIDVITQVLVKRHGIRVIMTTHSPSTVALAPEGAIFRLDRGSKRVGPAPSKSLMIGELTSGLVTVSKSTRFCFVEDDDDVEFYQIIWELLTDVGPSKDQQALPTEPSVVFLPVSSGARKAKVSGGFTVVKNWVAKLAAEPLAAFFVGLIDKDSGNMSEQRIHVLERYSFENYLLDPLTIYCLLLEEGVAPALTNGIISPGDEHLLRLQDEPVIQEAATYVVDAMEAADSRLIDKVGVAVTYTNGISISVPRWVTSMRGHDLLQIAQAAFGGARLVSPPRLLKALRRGRLIPSDLAATMRAVQSYDPSRT